MTQASLLKPEISSIIGRAQEGLMEGRYGADYWKYQACLGTHFVAQFYLLSRWMGLPLKKFDERKFREILLHRQRPDGSWQQWPDQNLERGDLDATVIHYLALKAMGESIESRPMSKARQSILDAGGVEKGTLFVQVIMALFGNLPWKNVPYIPYLIFLEHMPCNYQAFSHWSKPHVMAFSYMRHLKIKKDLGPLFHVEELKKAPTPPRDLEDRGKPSVLLEGAVIEKILGEQLHHGSWNGYTTSTLFSLVALTDYASFHPRQNPRISGGVRRGMEFLENLYLDERANPYLGVSCDGRNWDTLLVLGALVESGKPVQDLMPCFEFTRSVQSSNGGMGYGIDFDVGPDVDDTSEAVKLWSRTGLFAPERDHAVLWLLEHQNKGGGWGAFDKDNESSPLMKLMTRGFEDSDSLFDFPSADCTGHALEAIGAAGCAEKNRRAVKRAIRFLQDRQDPKTGSWQARWAVNHIFGTYVVVSGLLSVGEDRAAPYVRKAVRWFSGIQNRDGGFGESSDSYVNPAWIGQGKSTPSQTSWALLTLLEFGFAESAAMAKAARYLIDRFDHRTASWGDPSPVGTGHPGSAYMQYQSYAKAFPLLALAHLKKKL